MAALQGWIDEARDDLLTRRRIESAAHDWLAAGSDASFLFTGGRLELAESWAAESGFELTEDEQRFLTTSRRGSIVTPPLAPRRRRRIIQVLVGIVVVTAAVAAYALVQRSAADREARDDASPRARRPGPAGHRGGPGAGDHARPRRERRDERAAPGVRVGAAGGDAIDAAGRPRSTAWRLPVSRTTRTARWSPSIERQGSPVSSSSIRRTATCWLTWTPTTHGVAVWRSIRAAPSWPWPTRGSSGAPAIGRFEMPSGRAAGGFSGPAGSYEQLSYHPDGRWLGAVRSDDEGGDGRSSSGPSTPRTPRSRSGPGRRTPSSPAPPRWRSPEATSKVHSPSWTSRPVTWSGRSRRPTSTSTGSPSIRPATAWRCVSAQEHESWSSISTAASRSTLRRGRRAVGRVQPRRDDGWRSARLDNLVHLFDTENFAETLLAGSPSHVGRVSFAPDGSRLASISAGQLRFWELAPEGPPALGNFHTSGHVAELAVGEGESTAAATHRESRRIGDRRTDRPGDRRGRRGRRRAPLPTEQHGSADLRRSPRGRRAGRRAPHPCHRPRHRRRRRAGTVRGRARPRPERAPGARRRVRSCAGRSSVRRCCRDPASTAACSTCAPAARSSTSAPGHVVWGLRPARRRRPPRSRRRARQPTDDQGLPPPGRGSPRFLHQHRRLPAGRRLHGRRAPPGRDQGHRPARRDRPRPARRRSRRRSGVDERPPTPAA